MLKREPRHRHSDLPQAFPEFVDGIPGSSGVTGNDEPENRQVGTPSIGRRYSKRNRTRGYADARGAVGSTEDAPMVRATECTFLSLLAFLLALLVFDGPALAASPTSGESTAARQWMQNALLGNKRGKPFSFVYGGESSTELLDGWQPTAQTRELDARRREHTLAWTDAVTGLQVRCVVVEYADFPVVEWTLWLKNTGKEKTQILEDIQGLDTRFELAGEGELILHGIRGDSCVAESFRPFAHTLGPDAQKRFSPPVAGELVSGKSTDGPNGWPYFNLQKPGGGVIVVVGWPGQWEASFARDHVRGVRITAGQQLTHVYLKPGEAIRTPLIALLFWQGSDVVRAQNLWRSWYLAHNLPRINGTPQPPITQIQVDGSLASWPSVEAYLEAGIKPDICWRDAGGRNTWYPSSVTKSKTLTPAKRHERGTN